MCCVQWSSEAVTVHADITADHRDIPATFAFPMPISFHNRFVGAQSVASGNLLG